MMISLAIGKESSRDSYRDIARICVKDSIEK